MTDAQLRALLLDCLKLWGVPGIVTVRTADLAIDTPMGLFSVSRADAALRPIRWFYQTPERETAKRPPRAAPSVVALLSALRNGMAANGGGSAEGRRSGIP